MVAKVIVPSGSTMGYGVVQALGAKAVSTVLVSYNTRDIARKSSYVSETIYAPHPEEAEAQFLVIQMHLISRE